MNGHTPASDVDVDLGRLFASLREKWLRILVVALVVAAVAFVLSSLASPRYRAETRLLIETRESIYTRPEGSNDADRPILDQEGVASQVEVITSTDVLTEVARELNLASRPEFEGGELSLLGRLLVMAGLKSDPTNLPPEQRVLTSFRKKLNVYRVENSRVIVIEFSSKDPELAARVPNAIADTYVAVQREAKLQSNANATQWLEPEIADLRQRVRDAEARVAEFRSKSDLLIGQNNAVLATQQLSELSSELSRVRANRAAADARAQAVREALERGSAIETLPDVQASSLVQNLREDQVALKAQIAELSSTLLPSHPRIRALRSQLADLDQQIRIEARRVLEGLEGEAETARLRESELLADLNRLKAESARADEQQVELRALEREATAQRELLESYLTRFREAAARGDRNYLPADARIFSRAIVPTEPYFPKILPITAAAFFATLLVMAVVILLQELFSGRAIRPARRPVAPIPQIAMPAHRREAAERAEETESVPEVSELGEIGVETAAERLISGGATRAIFVSPEGDDAAAAAVMVAREVADSGLRVLLLDLTSSGAASQPTLESTAYSGITNLLASEAQFSEVIHGDLYSDCHVIPVGTADPARAMRAADRLPIVMESLTTAYDVVVVECGPADAADIRRLMGEGAEVLVSVLDPLEGSAAQTAERLKASGVEEPILVTPMGRVPPTAPPGRDAA